MEQLVDYLAMTGVDNLMVSILLVNIVQRDILERCHRGSDKLLQSGTEMLNRPPGGLKCKTHWG